MKRPTELDDTAARFWTRHSKRLQDSGLLTDATFDSFVLLCRTYALLCTLQVEGDKMGVIKFIGLSRQYQALSRGFAMNTDKPKQAERVEQLDEYGL